MYEKIKRIDATGAWFQKGFSLNWGFMKDFNADKILAYFWGELGASEQEALETAAANDPKLAQEIKEQKLIFDHIELLEDRKIAERVRRVHQKEKQRRQTFGHFRKRNLMAAAAVILLLLSVGWWIWQPSATPEKLFAENYSAYDLNFLGRGERDLLALGGEQYIAENYKEAATIFEELLQDSTVTKAEFALGICEMELENWQKATSQFEKVISKNDVLYSDNARWYLALANLKLGNLETAKINLKLISEKKGAFFQEKAEKLLTSF